MGSKRVGLARTEALIENLKREIQLNQATLVGAAQKTISLTGAGATKTLTTGDNGAIVLVAGSDASTVTLPALQDGARFTIYFGSPQAHVINGGAAKIQGVIYDNTNGTTLARNTVLNKTSITLVNAAAGDSLEFYCDGTNWYVKGWLNNTPTFTPS